MRILCTIILQVVTQCYTTVCILQMWVVHKIPYYTVHMNYVDRAQPDIVIQWNCTIAATFWTNERGWISEVAGSQKYLINPTTQEIFYIL